MIYKEQESEVVFSEKHWEINRTKIKSSITGKSKFSIYAKRPDTIMVVPFFNEREIIFIREYCPAYNKCMLFLPKGKIDSGESPEEAVKRELQEEINLKAREIKKIGILEDDKIKTDTHVFIAKNLLKSSLEGDELEASEMVRYTFLDFPKLIKSGELREARTIASLFMARDLEICSKH